jgi:hypothetical protein
LHARRPLAELEAAAAGCGSTTASMSVDSALLLRQQVAGLRHSQSQPGAMAMSELNVSDVIKATLEVHSGIHVCTAYTYCIKHLYARAGQVHVLTLKYVCGTAHTLLQL